MDSKELLKEIKRLKVDNERITRNHLDLQRLIQSSGPSKTSVLVHLSIFIFLSFPLMHLSSAKHPI